MKTRKKTFNRVVRTLANIYEMEYQEVLKIYKKQNRSVENTITVLSLINL